MPRRRKREYFDRIEGAPPPIVARIHRRVRFSEADVMGIAWHGRYASFAEEAWAELGRRSGLGYRDFQAAKLLAPIVILHFDYHRPLQLDEGFTVDAAWVWCEGARINTEYTLSRENGELAASGYSVQMLVHAETRLPCMVSPPFLDRWRARWRAGEFRSDATLRAGEPGAQDT
ncbi:MAG: acyl-CoA thioesterase [Deltaproteobacteria bacterium]|nr:acyl-CoA thioesterase [Deltaproteobacteria bacterium]MBM4268536.1 acyl-CoA thioesterase [Deltaproteobacteria bacterium]